MPSHKTLSACITVLGWLAVASAVTFEVKEGTVTCIKAEISANFSITYNTTNGTKTVAVPLPDSAEVGHGSSCGGAKSAPMLMATFGDEHALELAFSNKDQQYHVADLTLQYNLNDSTIFPQSSSKEVISASTVKSGIAARVNTTYRCRSSSSIPLDGAKVIVVFSNIRMQAYMNSANLSTDETVCSADVPVTTVAPVTTPSPSPVVPGAPDRGSYNVTYQNGTVCLLAKMGLQLNVTHVSKAKNKTVQDVVNLQPNQTLWSGSCGPNSTTATLVLTSELTNLTFTFKLNTTTKKYHLSAVNMSASWPDMTAPFVADNSTLNYLQGTLGRSYMCMSEQTLSVVKTFSINTFRLQVQPFGIKNGQFGSAEECRMDKDNMLIPIIVGAALAGLVLIVLIAYLIGRKRSHAGYQTI